MNRKVRLIDQACVSCPQGKYGQEGDCVGCPPGRYMEKDRGSGARTSVDACLICPPYSNTSTEHNKEDERSSACACQPGSYTLNWNCDVNDVYKVEDVLLRQMNATGALVAEKQASKCKGDHSATRHIYCRPISIAVDASAQCMYVVRVNRIEKVADLNAPQTDWELEPFAGDFSTFTGDDIDQDFQTRNRRLQVNDYTKWMHNAKYNEYGPIDGAALSDCHHPTSCVERGSQFIAQDIEALLYHGVTRAAVEESSGDVYGG